MKRITQTISEAVKPEKSIVIGVGRFNPPTTGHALLCDRVMQEAAKHGADHTIFVSYSQDPKKNPLDAKTKMEFLNKFFPKTKFKLMPKPFTSPDGKTANGPFAIMQTLSNAGYKKVWVVTGADHVAEYKTVKKYVDPNPKKKSGYKFTQFTVVNAGERDDNAAGVVGMSASKMRKAVFDNNYDEFSKGVPAHVSKSDARKLFSTIRKSMQLKEEWIWEEKGSEVVLLCLTSAEGSTDGSTIEKMEKSCKKKGITFHTIKMKFAHINSMKSTGDKIVIENTDGEGKKVEIDPSNTLCFVRGGVMNSEIGMGLAMVMQNNGVFMVNEKGAMEMCANKLQSALAFNKYNIPHPKTAFVSDEKSVANAMKAIGGKYPVIVKTITGAEGIGVSIIESEKSLLSVLQSLWKFGAEVILQEFLPGFKNDVRSIVLNGKIFACAKRDKAKGDFRTNIARGSKGGSFNLSKEEIELVEKVAGVSKCYYVGVDHVVVNGKPYVIEMNASPGSGNVYTLYKDGNAVKEMDGQGIIDALIEHVSDRSHWKLFTGVAITEKITVDGTEYDAKVDTGNSGYNCIHATNIKINEKNHTVTFLLDGKEKTTKKIVSRVKIKRGGSEESQVRPIVLMDVTFAGRDYKNIKFSITDRSHMQYKVLIGLRFLRQSGMQVDPKNMTANKPEPDTQTSKKLKSESNILKPSAYLPEFFKKFGSKAQAYELQQILETCAALDKNPSFSSRIEKARHAQSACGTQEELDAWEIYIDRQKQTMIKDHVPKLAPNIDEDFEWILINSTDKDSLARKLFNPEK